MTPAQPSKSAAKRVLIVIQRLRCRVAGYIVLNLLTDAWLPVTRKNSGDAIIRPSQITEYHTDDPVIAVAWPRPDLRIATLELLIGLLATACPPEDGDEWLKKWRNPPSTAQLDEIFAPFVHAFNLDGPGPRFLQDMEDLQSGAKPIQQLLIEAPGDATVGDNTDLMVHRDSVASFGRPAAAIALYTLQSWAPGQGSGHHVGLRGGGPLITLAIPEDAQSLWHLLWANVPAYGSAPALSGLPLVFPWLAPTVTSEGARLVTPENAHPLQCWWGMPQRVRLDFTVLEEPRPCGLTGILDTLEITTWRKRPHGANYSAWGRQHPLTPNYKTKTSPEWLPVHLQPGGIGFQDWLGLVMKDREETRLPAATISEWRSERGPNLTNGKARILAAGFDMNKAKARAFIESEMPLPFAATTAAREAMDYLAENLVKSANQVASLARGAVKDALFARGANVKKDALRFNTVRERLWEQTEPEFFAAMERTARRLPGEADDDREKWLALLRRTALALFDEAAPLSPDTGQTEAIRTATARKFLGLALAGYGKAGSELFTELGRPLPEQKQSKTKRKAA